MKTNHTLVVLIIAAWPLYYLYQHQLGAISFLLLAIFFLVKAIKELKMLKKENKPDDCQKDCEKIKQNNRLN
jgi:ABC-type iron transport system FetAB permease component